MAKERIEKIMIVKMLYRHKNNVRDDVCGFPLEEANRLIKARVAKKATKKDIEEYKQKNRSNEIVKREIIPVE